MTDFAREVAVARQAAAEAGAAALGMQAGIVSTPKGDGSPVTPGDLAADAILTHHLGLHFPDDGILSEEAVPAVAGQRRWWIIDPVDGTRDYAAGGAQWCVQVALVVDGVAVLGVLDLPAQGIQLWGVPGLGAWRSSVQGVTEVRADPQPRNRLIGSGSQRNAESLARLHARLPGFTCEHGHSVGVKVARLLDGGPDLYLHHRPIHAWDVAGPAAVLVAAGGTATSPQGGPLRYDPRQPVMDGLAFTTRTDLPALLAQVGLTA